MIRRRFSHIRRGFHHRVPGFDGGDVRFVRVRRGLHGRDVGGNVRNDGNGRAERVLRYGRRSRFDGGIFRKGFFKGIKDLRGIDDNLFGALGRFRGGGLQT